jgi:hypothetical protein
VQGGKTLQVPEGATRLEVRTPGQPTLMLVWNSARMRIEPKTYSALILLEFAPLVPGAAPTQYILRYTVIPADLAQ